MRGRNLVLVGLLIILVATLALAGCGGSTPTTEKTTPVVTSPPLPAVTSPPPVETSPPPVQTAPPAPPQATPTETMVVVTRTGEKYHTAGCRYVVGKTDTRTIPLSQAKAEGYTPCKVCNPPQ